VQKKFQSQKGPEEGEMGEKKEKEIIFLYLKTFY